MKPIRRKKHGTTLAAFGAVILVVEIVATIIDRISRNRP